MNILVAAYLSNVAYAQYSHANLIQENSPSLRHLAELVTTAKNHLAPHHKLVSRQITDENTITPEDEAFCNAKLSDVLCSTGLIQGLIDVELSCNLKAIKELYRPKGMQMCVQEM